MEDLRKQIRFDMERQFRRAYKFGIQIISAYYAALLPYYFVIYKAPRRLPVVTVTVGTLILLLVCLALLRSGRLHPRHYHMLAVVAITILSTPIILQLALTGDVRHHIEMGLILVMQALIFHDLSYFVIAQSATAAAWVAVILYLKAPGENLNLGLGVLSSLIVSLTAFLILRGLLKNLEELRLKDLKREQEKDQLHAELERAFERVRTLRGLVPICSHCKKIRDDSGFWQKVEIYVESHSHAEFTHGLCPECQTDLREQFEAIFPEPSGDGGPAS